MPELVEAAKGLSSEVALPLLEHLLRLRRTDPLAGYMAVHALAHISSEAAAQLLLPLVSDRDPAMRRHAAWALSRRRPVPAALDDLGDMVREGGFSQMMAELALEAWLAEMPELAWQMPADLTERLLWLSRKPITRTGRIPTRRRGLRIAQVLMQGRVDAGLTAAASGDGGGLITLQVGLTRELGDLESIAEAHLVTRALLGESDVFSRPSEALGDRGRISRLEFGPSGYLARDEMWGHRADLERALHLFLTENGPFDALHLRFADVGTFAAARVARALQIPLFFTLAPDPHSVIAAAESTGELTRSNFAEREASEHLIFRFWLVQEMLRDADRLALLPRQRQREQFQELMGIDVTASDRFVVVPEGVDYSVIQRAEREVLAMREGRAAPKGIGQLLSALSELPPSRLGLPLLLAAGRLSHVKGMDRVVAAWAGDPEIRRNYNLVLAGGNLRHPSDEERAVLGAIAEAAGSAPGLVLLGGQSHQDVANLMAAVALGVPGYIGAHGIYVCGSAKEEFGLAIVEALGAGLPVVAPQVGGPATYVDHEFTGYLADTLNVTELRRGIRWADGSRKSDVRADAARQLVKGRYSLSAMASELASMYSMDIRETNVS